MSHSAYFKKPINFRFSQSVDTFFVEEYLPFEPTNRGRFLLLKIKKQDMSTFKLISVIKSATGINERDIGYAGLKDKNAISIQYITIPMEVQKELKNITTDRVEILDITKNDKPLKIGNLSHNRFEILLRDISKHDAKIFEERAKLLSQHGIPNRFGYQRFGEDGESWKQGREIAHSGKRLKGSREKLLVSAWQSKLFNDWLNERVRVSQVIESNSTQKASKILKFPEELVSELKKQKMLFKLFIGDIIKRGKRDYFCSDMLKESKNFANRAITPTGLLPGFKAKRAILDARFIEERFDDDDLTSLPGGRREAWIYPKDISTAYNHDKNELLFSFSLPKGAYATTLLEEIGNFKLNNKYI